MHYFAFLFFKDSPNVAFMLSFIIIIIIIITIIQLSLSDKRF